MTGQCWVCGKHVPPGRVVEGTRIIVRRFRCEDCDVTWRDIIPRKPDRGPLRGAFTHLFRFDPEAVAVDPDGQKTGEKYRLGDWACVACRALASFLVKYDLDHDGECPGYIRAVPADASL